MARITLLLMTLVGFLLCATQSTADEGIAAQYPGDQGIEKAPSVIFATGFEQGIEEPLKINRKGVLALKNSEIAYSGQRCAQITATKDVDEGGDLQIKWDQGVDTCYMRVYVRFDKDTLMPHHFINLIGHTPTYRYRWGGGAGLRPSGGKDGAFNTTLEPPKGDNSGWRFYTYWHEMHSYQTPHGAVDGRPNPYWGNHFLVQNAPSLRRDEWICLEMMIKLNDLGEYNGEQAFWIDGKKVGHWKLGSPNGTWMRENFYVSGQWNTSPKPFEGFNWRTDDLLQINKATLQWYLSNNKSWERMTVEKNIVYFDNLVIATKYIGPMKK